MYSLCIIINWHTHCSTHLPSGHTAPGWLITSATWRGKRNIGIRAAQFRYGDDKSWLVMTSHDESEVRKLHGTFVVSLWICTVTAFQICLLWFELKHRRRCCWGKENHINFHSRTSQRLTFRTPDMTWKTKILKCTWVLWISGCGAWKSIWSMPVLQEPEDDSW